METFDVVFPIAFVLLFVLYQLRFSTTARSTLELATLNRIWESFNNHTRTTQEIRQMLSAREWKYWPDRVELLRTFLDIHDRYEQEGR